MPVRGERLVRVSRTGNLSTREGMARELCWVASSDGSVGVSSSSVVFSGVPLLRVLCGAPMRVVANVVVVVGSLRGWLGMRVGWAWGV
ncbi:hypothetical protein NRB20_56150 [Nocardia sp. RB20]|uniref:Uncharacterized protein n=1 Tax=Nocardia macrotermitis TaxID=2585198 RepID=A0A7K0D9V2_9NOCA|nr:hypothetical protein [Nocardia macrotermitis]